MSQPSQHPHNHHHNLPPKPPIPLLSTLSTLLAYLHPTIDAFTLPSLPFHIRLRLLAFQPLALLSYTLNHILCHLITPPTHRPQTIFIPVRNNRSIRALIYLPQPQPQPQARPHSHRTDDDHDSKNPYPVPVSVPVPIHIDFHSGAFAAGHPEANFRFCRFLAARGFLVISTTYRFAPRWGFPAAVEDVRDVIGWVVSGGLGKGIGVMGLKEGMEVDLERVTVGGASAGGCLAIAGCLLSDGKGVGDGSEGGEGEEKEEMEWAEIARKVKGIVTFYAPIDLRIPPVQKPRPAGFPKYDPLSFILPLCDFYAASGRERGHADSPVLSPCLARGEQVPGRVLMVVAGVDIIAKEQVDWAVRVNSETEKKKEKEKEKVELLVIDGVWHGWLELPSIFVDEKIRTRVFERCVEFLNELGRSV